MKPVLLIMLIFIGAVLSGCGGSDSDSAPAPEATTVFSTMAAPASEPEVRDWLSSLSAKVSTVSSNILTSPALTWESNILPLYDCLKELGDAEDYNAQLMIRSHDPAVRALANVGYQQIPDLSAAIKEDTALKLKVLQSLASMIPSNPKQKEAKSYLNSFFDTRYTDAELQAISAANESLTAVSLLYYQNAVTKSASATFSPAEFACLPSSIKSQIPTDSDGNYVFDANSSLSFTLAESCLPEAIRERLNAVAHSKAASENAPLWPVITERRLTYAKAFGFDSFAQQRLSDNMFQTTTAVQALLDNIETITQPTFERLRQRFETIQASEQGYFPATFQHWNRDRYYSAVRAQILGPPPANPKLLVFPEVFERMLFHFGRIVGLEFVKSNSPQTWWNSNVIEYQVYDSNTGFPAGTFLLDPYQISGLTDLANAGYLKSPGILESGQIQVPIVRLNANLAESPSAGIALSSAEYISFAHELGHAMHYLLKPSNASTGPLEDYMEIPSITFERIAGTPSFLKALLSADPLSPLAAVPDDLLHYLQYYALNPVSIAENRRYYLVISSAALHASMWTGGVQTELSDLFRQGYSDYYFPMSDLAQPGYSYTHLIKPGTDVAYYMYLFAEVIAPDILSVFEASPDSVFDETIGQRFRSSILEQSAYNRNQALESFLGRPWNYNAYRDWFETATSQL